MKGSNMTGMQGTVNVAIAGVMAIFAPTFSNSFAAIDSRNRTLYKYSESSPSYKYSELNIQRNYERDSMIEEIESFKSLPSNWDGYGAVPLKDIIYLNSKIIIGKLNIESIKKITDFFPNPKGTLSMMWEGDNADRISLEIGSLTFSYYVKKEGNSTVYFDKNSFSNENIEQLISYIALLV